MSLWGNDRGFVEVVKNIEGFMEVKVRFCEFFCNCFANLCNL